MRADTRANTPECKRCEKYRKRLDKIVELTRECLRDFNAERDTMEAYARLRQEGERIDRMRQREKKAAARRLQTQADLA